MKIVLRTVVGRFAPGDRRRGAETTRRRGITFSPRGGATVVLAAAHARPSTRGGGRWDPVPVPVTTGRTG